MAPVENVMSFSIDQEQIMAERQRSQRHVQATLGFLALGSLVFGLTIYALAARLGISGDTAKLIASAFLVAAILDAVVLYLWEHLFPSSNGE